MSCTRRRVVVDVDVGTDDFVALLMLLNADKKEEITIEGIVCTSGNTSIDNVCNNVVRLLETVGRTDIPVYKGAIKQLIPPDHEIKLFHGTDGFGDLEYDKDPDLSIIEKEPAAYGVANIILKNPNEITLICLGPLTNLALSIKLYDNFADSMKELWIMGGNYTALGNVTASAEYNFYYDPEAAFIVLDSIKKPIYILTWETCLDPKITFDWRFNVFGVKDNRAIQLLNRAEKSVYKQRNRREIWLPCDAFLAAAFLRPDKVITRQSVHHATIELHGSKTRGQLVIDHLKTKNENVTIIEKIDCELFKEMLLEL